MLYPELDLHGAELPVEGIELHVKHADEVDGVVAREGEVVLGALEQVVVVQIVERAQRVPGTPLDSQKRFSIILEGNIQVRTLVILR